MGVDAGAAARIRQSVIDLARSGSAVLVISQDLDELFEISRFYRCDEPWAAFATKAGGRNDVGTDRTPDGRGGSMIFHSTDQTSAAFRTIQRAFAIHRVCDNAAFRFFLFLFSGKDPVNGLYVYFVKPLIEVWSLHELAIKRGPLILIAVGFRWLIGRTTGTLVLKASLLPAPCLARSFLDYPQLEGWFVLPLMLVMGMIGGAAFGAIPAFLKVRFQTNEILTSLMLVYGSSFS